MTVQKFTIDRATWLRGEGEEGSELLRSDDKQCCLGFYLEACGVPREQLLNTCSPPAVAEKGFVLPEEAQWLIEKSPHKDLKRKYVSSSMCNTLMCENDEEHYPNEAGGGVDRETFERSREESIKNYFSQQNIEVEFV